MDMTNTSDPLALDPLSPLPAPADPRWFIPAHRAAIVRNRVCHVTRGKRVIDSCHSQLRSNLDAPESIRARRNFGG